MFESRNWPKFTEAPDDTAAGGASAPAPAPASAPATASSAATPATATAAPSAGTTPVAQAAQPSPAASASAAATGTPAAQPSAPSWLDGFRSEGLNFADEGQARQTLLQAYRDSERLRPLSPALSSYQQHQAEFTTWMQDRQKNAQKQAAEQDWTAALGWNPPPHDLNQLRLQVTQDDKGNIIPANGAPVDAVVKYQQAQQFRQEQIEKFLTNPFKYMEPAIRHIAGEIATKQSQQNVGQYREQQEAQSFIQKHSGWLFDRGENGAIKTQAVLNPQTGQHEQVQTLSSFGRIFRDALGQAAQNGIPANLQNEYALQATQNAYMASPEYVKHLVGQQQTPVVGQEQQPAQSPRQAANSAFTQRANPPATPAPTGGNATPAPPTVTRNNLEQVMLERFRHNNVTV